MNSNIELTEKSHKILIEAKKEFANKGFHAASVDNIATKAEVGKGTVYRHFGDKEALFLAVVKYVFNNFMEDIRSKKTKGNFRDTIIEIFDEYVNYFFKNKNFIQLVFHFISKSLVDEKRKKYLNFAETEIAVFKEIIEYAINNGEISPEYDIDHLADFFWGIASSVPKKILMFDSKKEEIKNHNEYILDIFLKGLLRSS